MDGPLRKKWYCKKILRYGRILGTSGFYSIYQCSRFNLIVKTLSSSFHEITEGKEDGLVRLLTLQLDLALSLLFDLLSLKGASKTMEFCSWKSQTYKKFLFIYENCLSLTWKKWQSNDKLCWWINLNILWSSMHISDC